MTSYRNFLNHIRRFGVLNTAKEIMLRLHDWYCERLYNVETTASSHDFNAETKDKNAHYYDTFHYSSCFYLLKYIPLPEETVLIDIGSGKARFLIAAATKRFRKLIGVEFSDLVKVAEENLGKMRFRRTRDIEFIAGDAQQYPIPHEVNVIFFNNPFKGTILDKVISNIETSLQKSPRKILIIYSNYLHFEEQIRGKDWIKVIHRGKLPQQVSYGIYEAAQ